MTEWNVHKTMAHTHIIDNMMTILEVIKGKYGASRTRDKFDLGSQVSSPGVKKYGRNFCYTLYIHPLHILDGLRHVA